MNDKERAYNPAAGPSPGTLFVLGARDSEMGRIQHELRRANLPMAQAMKNGRGVTGSNAKSFAGIRLFKECRSAINSVEHVVTIECDPSNYGAMLPNEMITSGDHKDGSVSRTRIDHHRPNDPGYGVPPERFMRGSSIGQLYSFLIKKGWTEGLEQGESSEGIGPAKPLNAEELSLKSGLHFLEEQWHAVFRDKQGQPMKVRLSNNAVMIAASDHCLHAAYRGRCPGVDPEKLRLFRLEMRSNFHRVPFSEINESFAHTLNVVRAKKAESDRPHFDRPMPYLPEAAAYAGVPITIKTTNRHSGQSKLLLQGAENDEIRDWIMEMKSEGLEVYGDPQRGFAGAVLPSDPVEKRLIVNRHTENQGALVDHEVAAAN